MTNATATTGSKKWNDEAVTRLYALVGDERPVPGAAVEAAAEALEVTSRSVASKLRQLGVEVESMATAKVPAFSPEQGTALRIFLNANQGVYTYKEVAEKFMDGAFSAKQVQGKVLALELTGQVRASEKVEFARTYTPDEEAKFVDLAKSGAFIEDIAAALGKEVASVRGKALSLTRNGLIEKIPAQKESHAKNDVDPVEALGDISGLTVAEIAKATDKTERGVKTLLTRRGINVKDYKGADKREKADKKVASAAAA